MKWMAALLLALAGIAQAQNPRVVLDTDRGPLLLEMDTARAPNTSANFLAYVDAGTYNNTLFHRIIKDFIAQSGAVTGQYTAVVATRPAITSERNNGLLNTPGTIAMALTSSGGSTNVNSATTSWFVNTGTNTVLDPNFTVFGRVVYGMKSLEEIDTTPVLAQREPYQPVRPPLIRRASRVAAGQFPILPLHTGAWFDPANSGRGFSVEVSSDASNESGPLLVVYWYDYFEGRQVWMNGAVPFTYGAHEITLPMQITSGAQFGAAFDPATVTSNANWGNLTVRFTGCSTARFSYTSSFGNGELTLQRATLPVNDSCRNQ